jgi:predicted amidohydrolase
MTVWKRRSLARQLRVAVTKAPIVSDVRLNSALIREQMRLAAVDGVRLVVFAEGALSGYVKRQGPNIEFPTKASEAPDRITNSLNSIRFGQYRARSSASK